MKSRTLRSLVLGWLALVLPAAVLAGSPERPALSGPTAAHASVGSLLLEQKSRDRNGVKTAVLDVLYDQTDLAVVNSRPAQDFETAYDAYDCEAADDFEVTADGGWTIDEVLLLGEYGEQGGPAESVSVVLYHDGGEGGPGGVACSSPGTIVSDDAGTLAVQLSSPCFVEQGTYWLGIQVNQDIDPAGQWFWFTSDQQVESAGRWRNPGLGFDTNCSGWGTLQSCLDGLDRDYLFQVRGEDHGTGSGGVLPPGGEWTTFAWTEGPGVFNDEGPFELSAEQAGTLDVTDAFVNGDVFEVYDGGAFLGKTSVVADAGASYTESPDTAFAGSAWSSGSFFLPAGEHSITFRIIAVPSGYSSGGGFVRWRAGGGAVIGGSEQQATAPGTTVDAEVASATDRSGRRVMVWRQRPDPDKQLQIGDGGGIVAQIVDSDDKPVGEPIDVAVETTNELGLPTVSFDGAGRFVIGWQEKSATGSSLRARFFASDRTPLGDAIQVDGGTGTPESPSISTNSAGELAAVWRQGGGKTTDGNGIFGRLFSAGGTPTGPPFRIDDAGTAVTEISAPSVASDASGNFVVTWHQRTTSKALADGDGIVGRLYDPTGKPAGDPFTINDVGGGDPSDPAVSLDGRGNVAAVWKQNVGGDLGWVICGRLFDRQARPLGSQFLVNAVTAGEQLSPSVAVNSEGDIAVVWVSRSTAKNGDGNTIVGRFFDPQGEPQGSDFEVAATEDGLEPGSPEVSLGDDDALSVTYSRIDETGEGQGVFYRTFDVTAPSGVCAAGEDSLCLNDNRFKVEVTWRDFTSRTGVGRAVPLTADTGYFWFFNSSNVELIIKVLDGTSINGFYWVFFGALSNVEYNLTVTDTETGNSVTYFNRSANFASVGDTQALQGDAKAGTALETLKEIEAAYFSEDDLALISRLGALRTPPAPRQDVADCTSGPGNLCLNDSRFRITVEWQDFQGNTGSGTAVPLTSDTGYFWFFNAANVELMVKVLDGRSLNGHFWVFYGALSNVEYSIRVTDTVTDEERVYTNPSGTFGSVGDTQAFYAP